MRSSFNEFFNLSNEFDMEVVVSSDSRSGVKVYIPMLMPNITKNEDKYRIRNINGNIYVNDDKPKLSKSYVKETGYLVSNRSRTSSNIQLSKGRVIRGKFLNGKLDKLEFYIPYQ